MYYTTKLQSCQEFFAVDQIEELADTILGQGGIKENLIVRPLATGGYELISGHRRRAAVQLLLDRGELISSLLPCVVREYEDDADRKLDLVLMNVSQRQLTDAELWQSYSVLSELMPKLKAETKAKGKAFGKVQQKLAELLGISIGQVSKLQNIQHNAIEEVQTAVDNGEISVNTAAKVASLDEEKQHELVKSVENLSDIRPRDLEKGNTNVTFLEDEEVEEVDEVEEAEEIDEIETSDDKNTDTPEQTAEEPRKEVTYTNPPEVNTKSSKQATQTTSKQQLMSILPLLIYAPQQEKFNNIFSKCYPHLNNAERHQLEELLSALRQATNYFTRGE